MANLNCTYYEIIIKPTSLPKKKAENKLSQITKLRMFKSNLCLCVTLIPKPLSHACANFLRMGNQLKFKKQKTQLPALRLDQIKICVSFVTLVVPDQEYVATKIILIN